MFKPFAVTALAFIPSFATAAELAGVWQGTLGKSAITVCFNGADGEHGIVLLAHCASLFRQFEFVQQQWMNYGLDFNAGNDSCPIVGNHPPGARFVIAAPDDTKPPFVASGLPQFVSTRGGDYFFAPSMTALRMIGTGVVDPT